MAGENNYRKATDRLTRTRMRPAVARARLLSGEWRRDNRCRNARAELRTTHGLFTTMGTEAVADRTRHELLATGDTACKRTVETASELAAEGRTDILDDQGRQPRKRSPASFVTSIMTIGDASAYLATTGSATGPS